MALECRCLQGCLAPPFRHMADPGLHASSLQSVRIVDHSSIQPLPRELRRSVVQLCGGEHPAEQARGTLPQNSAIK